MKKRFGILALAFVLGITCLFIPDSRNVLPAAKLALAQTTSGSLESNLLAEGEKRQVIRFNPAAALQKRIFADTFVPNSDEFGFEASGISYVAQRAEHLGTGQVRVYYARVGDWGNVRFFERGAIAGNPLGDALLAEGEKRLVIRFNPDTALQKRIFADTFVPNSGEFTLSSGGVNYAVQRAEHLGTGRVRVYYAKQGDWGIVVYVVNHPPAGLVTEWNVIATTAAAVPIKNGLVQTRIYAMMHAAIHDALNAIDRRYQPYALDKQANLGASPDAAVAAAAHDVLAHELPATQQPFLDAAYTKSLSGIPDGAAKNAGIAIGQAAAAAIIALRSADGADAPMPYTPGSGPGVWIPTAPTFLPANVPGWGKVTPFTLPKGAQFRLDRPRYFDLTSAEYAADYNEVKRIGAVLSSSRTAEQSQIAQFWYEPSAQGWNTITRFVSAQQGLDLWESARLFGLVNFALADGYIAHFDTKYLYNFWRPITAIQAGDTDGNDATVADPGWTPFLVTPNIPDYPSGHATAGAAAAIVLARFFGSDEVSFTSTSGAPYPGITRSYASFSHAAQENADSRVFAGIHFRTPTKDGLRLGKQVGDYVFSSTMKSIK